MYEIKKQYIEGLPENAYRNGVGNYEMVVGHSTADKEATDERELAYFINNWKIRKAFPHAFADWDSITELANPKYRAWGAGNANNRAVHVELCETKDPVKFKESYARWIWLMAYYLHRRNLPAVNGITLVGHDWVSKNLGGTNHADPIEYLKSWGKTWNDVVTDVRKELSSMCTDTVTVKLGLKTLPVKAELRNGITYVLIAGHWIQAADLAKELGAVKKWDNKNKVFTLEV